MGLTVFLYKMDILGKGPQIGRHDPQIKTFAASILQVMDYGRSKKECSVTFEPVEDLISGGG
jgi:hypothetical protein